MTKRKKSVRAVEQRVEDEARGSLWALRSAASLLALLGLVPMANLVTTGTGLPWWSEAVRQWAIWSAVVTVIAVALGATFTEKIERALVRGTDTLLAPTSRTFALLVGVTTCMLALYVGWRLFAWQPVVGDEFSQRFQARLLSIGRLFARAEAPSEFFSTAETLALDGRWFSQFPIGGPAILSVGVLAGVPFLVNPLLAGVAAAALYRFAAAITDEASARVAAILFALSPFVLAMAGSEMNHVGALAFLSLALAALPTWVAANSDAQARNSAALIGGGIGVAATIRPFDAAVVGLAIGIFQLRSALRSKPLVRSLLAELVVGAIPVLLLLAVNWATVGHPFAFAYDVLNGPEHRPGFHMTPLGFEHTPRRGLYIISAYLMKLDVGLFAWPVPAVLLVVLALMLQRRADAWDGLLVGMLALLMLGYAAYWSESYFVGPRFLFTAVPVFVLLTARLPSILRERARAPVLRAAVVLLVPFWLIIAWTAPARVNQLVGVRQLAEVYRTRGTASTIVRAVATAGLTNVVVFVPEGFHGHLAARLRALGLRPLMAEQIVAHSDACTVVQALDAASTLPAEQRAQVVLQAVDRDSVALPLAGLSPDDQLALVPNRTPSAACREQLDHAVSPGGSLAEMLPYQGFGARGEIGGSVIYARDFGRRNELLRPRFGDRAWYVARAAADNGVVVVRLEPFQSHQ